MNERCYETACGIIHYWTNEEVNSEYSLIFLPGLTADHRLFEKQIEHFETDYRILVWDAPEHAAS